MKINLLVAVLLFASAVRATTIDTITFDFSHDPTIYSGYGGSFNIIGTINSSFPPPGGEMTAAIYGFGPTAFQWIEEIGNQSFGLQIWNYCGFDNPLPVQQVLQLCGAAQNVFNGQAQNGDWIEQFPGVNPIEMTINPDGSFTGAWVPGVYTSTTGTKLTIVDPPDPSAVTTPEPSSLWMLGVGLSLLLLLRKKRLVG